MPTTESSQDATTPDGSARFDVTLSIESVSRGLRLFGLKEAPAGKVVLVFFSGFALGDSAGVVTSGTNCDSPGQAWSDTADH